MIKFWGALNKLTSQSNIGVTKFWSDYSGNKTLLVKDQAKLTSAFALNSTSRATTCTGGGPSCIKGFIVKRTNNGTTSFSPYLPKDMCEQYLYTQLTLELKTASRRDYTEVTHTIDSV